MASDGAPVAGEWRPPATSRAAPATMNVQAEGTVRIDSTPGGSLLATAPLQLVEVSGRVGQIPRRISFPDGSLFETPDNDGIDRLLAPHRSRRSGIVHRLERFGPRLFIFAALVVALSFALYRYAVPVLVEVAVAVTPPVVPQLMSQGVLASLDESVFAPSGLPEERRKAIAHGFAELTAVTKGSASAENEPAYSLNFRKGGIIGPNAFALPDGTIVLTDELVELAGEDDDLILGVLGHEMGHVDHDHSLRQLYRAAGVAALIMLIGGDLGGGTEDILVQGSAILALSYSRDAEREADRYSVEVMHEADRDPAAISRFFELLRDRLGDTGEGDFLSTHPATPERIEETKRYAEQIANSGQ